MTRLCPLRPKASQGNEITEFAPCIQEQCAWFDGNECVVRGLSSIADTLYDIRKEFRDHNTVYEESYDEPCE